MRCAPPNGSAHRLRARTRSASGGVNFGRRSGVNVQRRLTTRAAPNEIDLGIARSAQLGARRFEPFLEETSARISLAEDRQSKASDIAEGALAKLRELGAMSFIGPWLLSTVARTTSDPLRRREALAEGEAFLAKGAVSPA